MRNHNLITFLVGLLIGGVIVFLYFQPKLTYQGKSAQGWATDYSNLWKEYTQVELKNGDGYIPGLATPNPTPTEQPISYFNKDSMLPPGCITTINAYMKLGYSRFTTNQMLKESRPECAY
jgi:hypothetical protein